MSITDLIPWKRKKKTKVPIKVRKRPAQVVERDLDRRPDPLARWFGLAPFGTFGGWTDFFAPRMDLLEYDDVYKVTFEVPGLERGDLDVTLSGDRLTVRGQRREREKHQGRAARWVRQTQQAFQRSVLMPTPVNADGAEASLRRGVLTVELPKVRRGPGTSCIPIRDRR